MTENRQSPFLKLNWLAQTPHQATGKNRNRWRDTTRDWLIAGEVKALNWLAPMAPDQELPHKLSAMSGGGKGHGHDGVREGTRTRVVYLWISLFLYRLFARGVPNRA